MSNIDKIIGELIGLEGGPPVTFLAKQAVAAIQRKRLTDAAEVLRRKMASGKPWAFKSHEVAALTFDFLRAAEQGTARANLEMMADLIANGVADGRLVEDEVRHLMRIVAELSYDEMRAIAALLKASQSPLPEDPEQRQASLMNWARKIFAGHGGPWNAFDETLGALQRTGLVIAVPGAGGMAFQATSKLGKLGGLVDSGGLSL
jgi:hypothetical protein